MIYVALLRGINVGGNARVEMPKLKAVFESLGTNNVSTYINSGNVIFSDQRSDKELVPLIESAIDKQFKLKVRIVLRDLANIQLLCQKIPSRWTNDVEQRTDVLFLWEEIDSADILKKIVINKDLERVRYIDGALVWNIDRENVLKGNSVKLIKSDFYKHMTIRNINTVRKIYSLMSELDK